VAIVDARELPNGTVIQTDVCIVGSGAAGITVARELAGTQHDVVVLESGAFEPDEPTQDLYRGEVVGEPLLNYTTPKELHEVRLRLFGGSTHHWAGYCRPLQTIDFETRSHLAVSGWPFGLDELAPWYERAAATIRLAGTDFSNEWWAAERGLSIPTVDSPLVETSLFQVKYPFSFAAAYRPELEEATNVRVHLWANATRIAMRAESDEVEAIEAAVLDGPTLRVEARVYVIALGGIENARLLLASDDVRTAGVGNSNDLVGRYFAEHLQVLAGVIVFRRPFAELEVFNGLAQPAPQPDLPDEKVTLKGVLSLSGEALRSRELLGLEGQMLLSEPRPGGPDYANGLGTEIVRPLLEAGEAADGTTTAFLQVLAEQELQPDSRVLLGSTRDAVGVRQAQLDWRHSDLDRQSILEGLRLIGAELGRTGTGRLQIVTGGVTTGTVTAEGGPLSLYAIDVAEVTHDDFPIGMGFHHMCTTRMASDPAHGVVDPDCRVHDVANLYVAGSSVFATGGVATPTFTITALAHRLGEHLKTRVLV
jgi:choline dehydrogenase-like flavoprotein